MDINMPNLDWSHLQSFIAVAEHGSLSAAARARGSSQPTLSRHIAHLEQSIGARLFERMPAGVVLTQKGSDLMAHASQMADAAAQLAILTAGGSQTFAGTVRITASQIVATYLLPPVLAHLHLLEPNIEIEVVASDDTNNLLRREADIALRMYRPTQEDVISRHIGDLKLGAYAANSYIERKGMPHALEEIADHDVIGYDRSTMIIDGLGAFGMNFGRNYFKFRSDDQVVCWQMVRAGFGIGFNQIAIGDADTSVQRVFADTTVGALPIWLTAHPEVKQTPRIRKVYNHLNATLLKNL
jgi:DNA-binding transcriptional LysR family regulator